MKYLFPLLLTALFLVSAPCAPALAGAVNISESFTLCVESHGAAKRVLVRYNHPYFGWVDAGYVDFKDDGGIVLKIRGENAEEISDLGSKLSRFSEKRIGDPSVGLQLAMNIEGAAAGR